jgi:glycerate dehydrogenase
MRIVVLDGHTLNPGDLSWEALEALAPCEIHPRSSPQQTLERARHADVVLTNKTPLDAAALAALPQLKFISILATGANIVDLPAAAERGIVVSNVPGYGARSVAQMVFAHVLNLTQRVGDHAQTVRDGRWARSSDFCYWDFPLIELAGLTMGIVGLGEIGNATAELARAFGMRVLATVRKPREPPEGVELVDLDALFRQSDVLSLHCPLTPATEGLVNAARLAQMKPTALLVNTSRGPLIDEAALAAALGDGRLAGAGLDVLSSEPPAVDNPLCSAPNCYITPHIAWATRAARSRLLETTVANVAAFLEGNPQNVING